MAENHLIPSMTSSWALTPFGAELLEDSPGFLLRFRVFEPGEPNFHEPYGFRGWNIAKLCALSAHWSLQN